MHSVGLVVEYNPFHNGHLYHLNKVKEIFPNYIIILVMSGHFMQRGDVSIINKWDKTKIALEMGIDLVIELPFAFASQSADLFAYGSISILNALNVEAVVFGSETGDIEVLKKMASLQENESYHNNVRNFLDEGINYPTAMAKAIKKEIDIDINSPNDLLGISYIKAINKLNSSITPITIKRTNDYHDLNINGTVCSATAIREALKKGVDIKDNVPSITYQYLHDLHFIEDYFDYLKYKIISTPDLSIYQTVDEGLENRIKKAINNSNNLEELIFNIKTKRYTYNKIKRMLTHILCSFTKDEASKMKNIEYIRVLGFNQLGQKYLNSIKKKIDIPIITKYKPNISLMLDLDYRTTNIYLLKNNQQELINLENKPIIKK